MLTINEETKEVSFTKKQPFDKRFVPRSVLFKVPLSNHEMVLLEQLGWDISETTIGWEKVYYVTVNLVPPEELWFDLNLKETGLVPIQLRTDIERANLERMDFEASFVVTATQTPLGKLYVTERLGVTEYLTKVGQA